MNADQISKNLEKIYFTAENGLVFCDNPDYQHIGELYHIKEKAAELGAAAVLFRRKYDQDNRIIDSKPAVYIYEKENNFLNKDEHKEIHAKIWSGSEIEVYFILSQTSIDIFNARRPAVVENREKQELNLEKLRLVSEALEQFNDQRFSAILFAKGAFWEQEDFFEDRAGSPFFENRLHGENSPFHQLLKYLNAVRKNLPANQRNLSKQTIDKLLITCILVKFLEETKDVSGKHTLRAIYKKYKLENFAQALTNKMCIPVLNDLAEEFNGHIFDNFEDKEKEEIKGADLQPIADFLTAKLDLSQKGGKQYFLWKQYSFKHLPPELISSIYENFLPKEKGVVYTPPFLVNFLIDQAMPLDQAENFFLENKFKVFDPACGSGIFLTAAYKRMLQWWSVNHYKKAGKVKFPGKETCKEILEKNIFGVDIHPTATLITIFSLTIALLDKLEPKEIWNNLRFSKMEDNIQSRNFFTWAADNKDKAGKFNLVIGNPPFNRNSDITEQEIKSEDNVELFGIKGKDIPGNNFALKFFEGAMFFAERTCLIIPSGVLLYTKTKSAQKYRSRIFTKFTVKKIFDFTHLRRQLFGSSDTSTCAVLADTAESQKQKIEQTVIKRIISTEKKIAFEIDHYDRYFVPHNWAIDPAKQFIWKTNLLGGGRLFHLIYRLSLLPTLNDFINSKKDWEQIRGFEGGRKLAAEKEDRIIKITEKGEPVIEEGVDIHSNNLKSLFMYEPPFMVIDMVLGKSNLSACFVPENNKFTKKRHLYYNRDFIGISVPEQDENILKDIFHFIRLKEDKNELNCQLFAVCISSNCLIQHETAVRKGDILSLPYCPENQEYLRLSKEEKILQDDVLQYYIHSGKAISEKGEGRKLHQKVSEEQLRSFGEVFCSALNPIYAKHGKSWQCGNFYQTEAFTIFQFGYGKNNKSLSFQKDDQLDDTVRPLIYNTSGTRAIFTRVCRIYKRLNGCDCLFLIKPHAIRYWLNSIALRDADETFADLKKAGR